MAQNPPTGATAYDYLNKKWGGPTRTAPLSTVSVGTTPTRAYQNNPRRMLAALWNIGASTVFWGPDSGVTAATGIPIPSQGGSLILSVDEDGELVAWDGWVIASVAGQTVTFLEVFRV